MPTSEDEIEIVLERLRTMPSTITLNIGGHGSFNRDQLIEQVEKRTEIGDTVVEMYISYLRSFKEEID
ncbi:MAG: hypothetical protein ACLFUZ_03285 [Candidatus Micrarchaeia archaeon]